MPYVGMCDAHNGYLFATIKCSVLGQSYSYGYPKSRTPGIIRVGLENPNMTCAIVTHAMALINHVLYPSPDDRCKQL